MGERRTDTKVVGFYAGGVRFTRMPYSPYQYRYYMKIKGVAIRISKDVYRAAKLAVEEE